MAHSRWTVRPYAAGLAAVLALGACSGGGGAPAGTPAGPSTSGVTTTTASPTSTAPTTAVDPVLARIPAAARPETMEGAAAYAAFYLRQLNEASKEGDPALLDGLAMASCPMCTTFYNSVTSLQAEQQHHVGDALKVTDSETLSFVDGKRTALVRVKLYAVPIVDAAGRQVDTTEADTGAFVATLAYKGRWYIARLQVAK